MTSTVLNVPQKLVNNCNGLALDIGGSLIKVVYKDCDGKNASSACLKCISFSKDYLDEALEFIKKNSHALSKCNICTTFKPTKNEKLLVYSTGIGCTQYGKPICDALNVELQQCTEFDCFVKAFHYLANEQDMSQLVEPFERQACEDAIGQYENLIRVFELMKAANTTEMMIGEAGTAAAPTVDQLLGEIKNSKVEFPCLFVGLGSGFGYMEVSEDGKFRLAGGNNRGGKAFIGLGRLITGCKTFEEQIELAMKGDKFKIGVNNEDLIKKDNLSAAGDDSIYSDKFSFNKPSLIYCFGKVADEKKELSEFSKADLAAAWLEYHLLDLSSNIALVAKCRGLKTVYICGSYASHPHIRKMLTLELSRFNLISSATDLNMTADDAVKFGFLKMGGHAGAIGCLVHAIEIHKPDFVHL